MDEEEMETLVQQVMTLVDELSGTDVMSKDDARDFYQACIDDLIVRKTALGG